MTNTDIEFTRNFRSYKATALVEDGSFWLYQVAADAAFRVIIDVDALQAGLDQITNNPQTWNQGSWFTDLPAEVEQTAAAPECGTAGCLAGTISLLNGARPALYGSNVVLPDGRRDSASGFAVSVLVTALESKVMPDPEEWTVDADDIDYDRGRLLSPLWDSDNSLSDLWDYGQFLTSGRLVRPSDEVIEAAHAASRELYNF